MAAFKTADNEINGPRVIAFVIAIVLVISLSWGAWERFTEMVPNGNCGIIIDTVGSNKGEMRVVGVGRAYLGFYEQIELFPLFVQTYNWTLGKTEGSPADEAIYFSDKDSLALNADIGLAYHIDPNPEKIVALYKQYRKNVDDLTRVVLRNIVRDEFQNVGSKYNVEQINGEKKEVIINEVRARVSETFAAMGLKLVRLDLLTDVRMPEKVRESIVQKIVASQQAKQKQNELQSAEADAQKEIAVAEGKAQAKIKNAQATATENKLLKESLTSEIVQFKMIEKWNGQLPYYSGGGTPLIQLPGSK